MKEVELADHQKKAVARLRNGKILTGGVGSGKTRVAVQYYMQNEWESDLIVITTAKKRDSRDWEDEAADHGIGTDRDASLGKTITVDSWNNLWRYVDVDGAFFVFDEQRLVGSGAWVKVFQKIAKNNRWILLSATPGDTWLDYIPVFVANGLYKNRTDFLREHVVYSRYSKFPKVEKYIGVNRLVKHRNDLLVDMPYERSTVRHIQKIEVDYDVDLFKRVVKERWHVYENRPIRDVAELFAVMRKVVNTSPSRLESVQSLLREHPRLIVFYNFDYELEILRTLANTSAISPDVMDNSTYVSTGELDQSPSLEDSSISSPTIKDIPLPTSDHRNTNDSEVGGANSTKSRSEVSLRSGEVNSSTRRPLRESIGNSKMESIENSENSLSKSDSTQTSQKTGDTSSNSEILSSPSPMTTERSIAIATSSSAPNPSSLLTKDESISSEHLEIAEWNGHKHQPIPTTDRWVYLVQYTAGAEGWNCVETNTVVFYSLNYSYRLFEQCQGRIDRLNTVFIDLYYYVLRSTSVIDMMIWKAIKTKHIFNESKGLKNLGRE